MNHQYSPLILDVAGQALTAVDRRRLMHPMTGGLILFARNWKDRQQLTDLCASIKEVRKDILICVDHEGGRVQRFKTDGFTHLPPMRALGHLWMTDEKNKPASGAMKATQVATACGYILGSELRACGVDFSFTPVLDLDHGDSSVVGDRSFHRDARVVVLLVKSLMQGLLQSGVSNCGKHFPGHGFVKADSHIDLPVDDRSLQSILIDCALPYQWLNNSLMSVMPAHVIYSKVDNKPAGFSNQWLQEILRQKFDFQGAIISDDLSMAAARFIDGQQLTYTQAALVAIQAGCDLVLLCNQSLASSQGGGGAIDDVLDGLTQAQQTGQWLGRSSAERRRLSLFPASPALGWDALMASDRYRQAQNLLSLLV